MILCCLKSKNRKQQKKVIYRYYLKLFYEFSSHANKYINNKENYKKIRNYLKLDNMKYVVKNEENEESLTKNRFNGVKAASSKHSIFMIC